MVVNIINKAMPNQVRTGALISSGFQRLGYKVIDTSDRQAVGDITVVHGCNYAKDQAVGRVLWLDRCFYGDTDEWQSLGWKVDNHVRTYATGDGGRFQSHQSDGIVRMEDAKAKTTVILLDDHAKSVKGDHNVYRGHPAHEKHSQTLSEALRPHSRALCGYGTCAAQAWLAGLSVDCNDIFNEVHTGFSRDKWASDLAWKQFSNEELSSGLAVERLLYGQVAIPKW